MKQLVVTVCAATLLLAGCGGSDSDGAARTDPTSSPSSGATSEPTKSAETVKIEIKDGKVTPQGARVDVEVGQTVRLVVTSDADEEIHVHSEPEHSYEIAAGGTVTESFTINTPGQVAVEAHHLDVTVVQLVVRP